MILKVLATLASLALFILVVLSFLEGVFKQSFGIILGLFLALLTGGVTCICFIALKSDFANSKKKKCDH